MIKVISGVIGVDPGQRGYPGRKEIDRRPGAAGDGGRRARDIPGLEHLSKPDGGGKYRV